ncbi:hypothetical protein NA78x_004429 [Anatilimnocola sp. NA78]|uniref:hypothetical protein n=1 Tax=Anatilimnocola sp. NA78 TaxID=3415683 RepID=UPI003CE53AB1
MLVHCPRCRLALDDADQFAGQTVMCPQCGQPFAMPVPYYAPTALVAHQQPEYHEPAETQRHSLRSPGLAAVLCFFWTGLGQIYNGQIAKGLLLFCLQGFLSLLSMLVFFRVVAIPYHPSQQFEQNIIHYTCFVPALFAIMFWIWAIFDAHLTAVRLNARDERVNRIA